ncbi:MAG TPA: thioredoxin family protein [Thermodesulfobacteriota bacterium]|nr:thioredoxin family protein [Thermodesulfobacteriota bacterium]
MKIEVLGMGCSSCNRLYRNVLEAVKSSRREVQLEKVEDIKRIVSYGVLSTPALVIDGVVKTAGKIPSAQEILSWIR